jgi:hypothetical protein
MSPRPDPALGLLPGLPPPGSGSRFVRKVATVVAGAALVVLGLAFSVVFLAVAAVAGLAVWAYVAWKTRALRRDLRQSLGESARGPIDRRPAGGDVIEGVATQVPDDPR